MDSICKRGRVDNNSTMDEKTFFLEIVLILFSPVRDVSFEEKRSFDGDLVC